MKNYVLLFILLSFSLVLKGQSVCTEAVTAVVGTNSFPATSNDSYWYKYTMPMDGTIQAAQVGASSGIPTVLLYVNNCDNARKVRLRGATILGLKQGNEVFIEWPGSRALTWKLTVSPAKPGDTPSLAAEAVVGANSVPSTSYEEYWYHYTMPSNGKLRITSSASKAVTVYKYKEDGSFIRVGTGGNVTTVALLTQGDKLLIEWHARRRSLGGNFTWNLAVSATEPGDACVFATEATTGTNFLPTSSDQYYWYKYTMPRHGKLQITAPASTDQNIRVYRDCGDTDYYSGQGTITVETLRSGEEVFLRWATSYGSGFNWDLSIVPFDAGEDCSSAVSPIEGVNQLPVTSYKYYWYKFTMPRDGRLQVTSSSEKEVKVYQGTCNSLSDLTSWYGENPVVGKDQEVFIRWNTQGEGEFAWDLTISPLARGEDCLSAEMAIPYYEDNLPKNSFNTYWYVHTMQTNGKLRVQSQSSNFVTVVSGTCKDPIWESGGEGNTTATTLKKDDQVFIMWEGPFRSDLRWTLSERSLEEGDNCSLATSAANGTNTLPAYSNGANWYSYTMPIDGKLQITPSDSSDYEYAEILIGSCDAYTVADRGYRGANANLKQGDQVLIMWDLYSHDNFTWDLSTHPLSGNPQTITVDAIANQTIDASPITVNASTTSELPLSYTVTGPAAINGNVITLNGTEGLVQVTVSQIGNHHYQSASTTVSFTVTEPHQTTIECKDLMVAITGKSSATCSGATNGSLTVSANGGESPYLYSLNGGTFQEGARFTDLGSGIYQITVKDANGCKAIVEATIVTPDALIIDGQVDASSESSGSGQISLTMSGGTVPYRYLWSNGATTAIISNLRPGDYSVTITDAQGCTATDSFIVAEEKVTSVEELQRPETIIAPNPIRETLNVDVPPGSKIKEAVFYNSIGKAVIKIRLAKGKNRINTSHLPSGSYLLRLDDGTMQRVIIQ